MVVAKKKLLKKVLSTVLFLYLVVFPFGQLLRIKVSLMDKTIYLHLTDVVVGVSAVLFILGLIKINKTYKYILNFLIICIFSLLFSLSFYKPAEVLIGFLYFLRFLSYTTLFLLVWNLVKIFRFEKKTLFNSLVLVSAVIGVFGWIQYFLSPDLRFLKYLCWDDHLNRLVGAFLDPGFTSILLVLGFLASYAKYLKEKGLKNIFLVIFFLISIAFTYARASYVSLVIGFLYMVIVTSKRKLLFLMTLIFTFLVILFFIPRGYGEGVRLERTFSIFAKVRNYEETLVIVKKYPIFGVGFNNLCLARNQILKDNLNSHSCSGSDSSILFILATTGIVGLFIFLGSGYTILKSLKDTIYAKTFLASTLALIVHSLFVHSLFYPWVMGWMAILLALSVKEKRY